MTFWLPVLQIYVINQHGKDKKAQTKWGKPVLGWMYQSQGMFFFLMPISAVITELLQPCLEEHQSLFKDSKKIKKDHCW